MDLMLTIAMITTLATLAVVGVAALPWSEPELDASLDAMNALGEGVRSARLPAWSGEAVPSASVVAR